MCPCRSDEWKIFIARDGLAEHATLTSYLPLICALAAALVRLAHTSTYVRWVRLTYTNGGWRIRCFCIRRQCLATANEPCRDAVLLRFWHVVGTYYIGPSWSRLSGTGTTYECSQRTLCLSELLIIVTKLRRRSTASSLRRDAHECTSTTSGRPLLHPFDLKWPHMISIAHNIYPV